MLTHVLRTSEHVAVGQRIESRVGGGTRDRVAAEGAAEPAGRNAIHDLGAPGDSRQRHATAQRLAGHEQVRLDAPVLDGPQRSRAACARLDLVVHVDDSVLVADPLELSDELLWHRDEAALALYRF